MEEDRRYTESPLLFDKSEREMRRMAPSEYTEVFVPDSVNKSFELVGVLDTTALERECAKLRKDSPDFRVTPNRVDGKLHHVARIPPALLHKEFPEFDQADQVTQTSMMRTFLQRHPEFKTTKNRNLPDSLS